MTYVNDPIGDFLTRMRNAQNARKSFCRAPFSRIKQDMAEVLKRDGWIQEVAVVGDEPKLELEVTFVPGKTVEFTRVSKPGRRVYSSTDELMPILRGFGAAILTTSQGILTDKEARQRKIGGEVLCTIS
jgi:small subunit ribosomal protein S8